MFSKEFANSILANLGPSGTGRFELASDLVKKFDFGKAAISLYNLSLLMSPNVDYSPYSDVLNTILPTSKTNPDLVSSFIVKFSSLLDSVRKEYFPNSKQKENTK